jgi:HEAT repeat protein
MNSIFICILILLAPGPRTVAIAETAESVVENILLGNITSPREFEVLTKNRQIVVALIRNNSNPKVRAQAAFTAGEMKFEEAIPNLTEALLDKDSWVVKSAAEGLSNFDEHGSASNLIIAIQQMPDERPIELSFLLMFLPDKLSDSDALHEKAIAIVRRRHLAKNEDVKFWAMCALAYLKDPEIRQQLYSYSVSDHFKQSSEEERGYYQMELDHAKSAFEKQKPKK